MIRRSNSAAFSRCVSLCACLNVATHTYALWVESGRRCVSELG